MLVLITNGIAQKQDQVKTIEINANGKIDSIPKYLKYGSFVQFEIKNVNNLLYSAGIAVNRDNFNYDVPSVFTEIGTIEIEIDSAQMVILKGGGIDQKPEQSIGIQQFNEAYVNFQNIMIQINQRAALKKELNKLIDGMAFIKDTTAIKDKAREKYQAVYPESFENEQQLFNQAGSLYKILELAKKEMNLQLYEALTSAKKSSNEVFEISINQLIQQKENDWDLVKKAYEKLTDEEAKKELLAAIKAGRSLYRKILVTDFILFTPVVKVDADLLNLTPKLYSKKDTVSIKGDFNFRSQGGWKVNFSAGYLLSFRGDENYNLVKDADGNSVGVKKGNSSGLTHALGGLVHIYPRGYRNYQPGFSAGISTSDNGDLGFHLGGSLLATEGNNRVIFSLGVSFTSLQKLNRGNLQTNEAGEQLFRSATDTEIKYDNVYKLSVFAGITFNLSKAADKEDTKD